MKLRLIFNTGWVLSSPHGRPACAPRLWPTDKSIPEGWEGIEIHQPEIEVKNEWDVAAREEPRYHEKTLTHLGPGGDPIPILEAEGEEWVRLRDVGQYHSKFPRVDQRGFPLKSRCERRTQLKKRLMPKGHLEIQDAVLHRYNEALEEALLDEQEK